LIELRFHILGYLTQPAWALPGKYCTEETDRMGDKIRGSIAILFGGFGICQGLLHFQAQRGNWHMWVELVAGLVLIGLGVWRIRRKQVDPTAELLK
jgi:hypothetical protein